MKYPKNELAQLVIASLVSQNLEDVIVSPGSRNAPLTIGLTSHPKINTYSIVDERCAAFIALGMAQQKQKPVALLCTSGSALLNYYPAIAEAFYSEIPLVVLSADRPEHYVDIGDGQTIRQKNVFENHSLFNANLREGAFSSNKEKLESALSKAYSGKGPVHINIPFEEPLYDTVSTILELESKAPSNSNNLFLDAIPSDVNLLQRHADVWNQASKKIVLVGAHYPDELLQIQLQHFSKDPSVLVFLETTSNATDPSFINGIDQLLFPLKDEELEQLKPDILVTLGGMVVSKKIKQFFRKYRPDAHWHIDPIKSMDTFQCLTQHFKNTPQLFLSQFFFLTQPVASSYQKEWLQIKRRRKQQHAAFLKKVIFSDLKAHELIYASLPDQVHLQLGNSSVVRYAQFFEMKPSWRIFCNRGTSGIEGSTSTAIGAAMASEIPTVFITGDLSFFYDSNALWNAYVPNSFRIVLINNNGGGIFKVIPGPSSSEVLDYFETPHGLNAAQLCEMHGFAYQKTSDERHLKSCLQAFYQVSNQPKLLEITTPSAENDLVLKAYFKEL